jgi:hypothetical protein
MTLQIKNWMKRSQKMAVWFSEILWFLGAAFLHSLLRLVKGAATV